MAVMLTLELPEDAFSITRSSPDEFAREFRLAAAVMWYEIGRISQSKAAELAGISRREFLDALARFEVSPFQVTPEELADELARAWVVRPATTAQKVAPAGSRRKGR